MTDTVIALVVVLILLLLVIIAIVICFVNSKRNADIRPGNFISFIKNNMLNLLRTIQVVKQMQLTRHKLVTY